MVAACGDGATAENDTGLTAAEDRQLDRAAKRIDREREAYQAELAAQNRTDAASRAAEAAQLPPQPDGETPELPDR